MKYHCGRIAFEAEGEIKGDAVPVQHFDGRVR